MVLMEIFWVFSIIPLPRRLFISKNNKGQHRIAGKQQWSHQITELELVILIEISSRDRGSEKSNCQHGVQTCATMESICIHCTCIVLPWTRQNKVIHQTKMMNIRFQIAQFHNIQVECIILSAWIRSASALQTMCKRVNALQSKWLMKAIRMRLYRRKCK